MKQTHIFEKYLQKNMKKEIRKQVQLAIDEANVILFLVDAKDGITDLDLSVVDILRISNKNRLEFSAIQ